MSKKPKNSKSPTPSILKLEGQLRVKVPYNKSLEEYLREISKVTQEKSLPSFRIISRSLDARGANRGKLPHYLYHLDFSLNQFASGVQAENSSSERTLNLDFPKLDPFKNPPIIIGAGPAGLFAALRFEEYSIPTIMLERGEDTYDRMKKIARYWRYGEFDPDNNVCYGIGGAGLFSDGKLVTRVKSPFVKYVMKKLVQMGAPEHIVYDANPHLGSNKIRSMIKNIAQFLEDKGHKIRRSSEVVSLLFSNDNKEVIGVQLKNGEKIYSSMVFLGVGHSARKIYSHLQENKVAMQAKDFAVGIRIEHPREEIDRNQLGDFANDSVLGAARYRLSYHDDNNNRGCYSFCMCPGGYVLSSGTQERGLVVNGMSNYGCRSRWSNSAIVVSVKNEVDFNIGGDNLLDGMDYQKNIESKAYLFSKEKASGKEIPYQHMDEFLNDVSLSKRKPPKNSIPSGIFHQPLKDILPNAVTKQLGKAFEEFDRSMPGYLSKNAVLYAPETRTSSPVTILRDKESLESISHRGLYPIGEGAGYAGGITSAAVDGVKATMAALEKHRSYKEQ